MSDEETKPTDNPPPKPQGEPIKPSVDLENEFRKGGEPKQKLSK